MPFERWNIVYLSGLVIFGLIRGLFEYRTKGRVKAVRLMDATERVLLGVLSIGIIVLPFVYLFTPLLGFADHRLPAASPWAGMLVMIASLWLFYRSHADLGRNWSVTLELLPDHKLITQGVYRYIRHPMYTSIFLWGLAQGLLLQNWLAGWSALATFTLLYLVRTPREERMMIEHFGDEYRDYMHTSGRVIPRLWG